MGIAPQPQVEDFKRDHKLQPSPTFGNGGQIGQGQAEAARRKRKACRFNPPGGIFGYFIILLELLIVDGSFQFRYNLCAYQVIKNLFFVSLPSSFALANFAGQAG